ncbi:MAG: ABC-type sugar transport system, periplasmic component [Caproiciproducens sp.]|jgi:ribose transport system substrate-binding protein|nr:ABC-type sugar transport system, periplasmic component [Caproiciproducens sp.]
MKSKILSLTLALALIVGVTTGCSAKSEGSAAPASTPEPASSVAQQASAPASSDAGKTGIVTTMSLNDYKPKKSTYNFYFTYKLVHPWWDAVKVGMNDAVKQLKAKGITVNFEYTAPTSPDAIDQVNRLETAAGRKFDVIGADITELKTVVPVVNKLVESGIPFMTFSSSDAPDSKRICYVGNTRNVEDGAAIAEALAKSIGYKGEIAALGGTIGAPVHEDRLKGLKQVLAKYPDIKLVDTQFDNDDLEKSVQIAENMIQKYPNLKGFFCNNMTNPIGAAQAVEAAGKTDIKIVGMDHDLRTLQYVKKGTILCVGVQNCFAMGFDTIQTAIKLADGIRPGDGSNLVQVLDNKTTTLVYQDSAQAMIDLLYPGK